MIWPELKLPFSTVRKRPFLPESHRVVAERSLLRTLLRELTSAIGPTDGEDVDDLEDADGIEDAKDDEPCKVIVPARAPEGDGFPDATPDNDNESDNDNQREI